MSADPFEHARKEMLRRLRRRGIRDERVLKALAEVPRHLFVPPDWAYLSYLDVAVPVGEGQTATPPFYVAFCAQALRLRPEERVLELGTGTGFQAAVLSRLAREVVTVEISPVLAKRAEENLRRAGIKNVKVLRRDGRLGVPELAPFSAILYAFALPKLPEGVLEQLSPQGRLLIPLGTRHEQKLWLYNRKGEGRALIPILFTWVRG